jgi:hypothetical protein
MRFAVCNPVVTNDPITGRRIDPSDAQSGLSRHFRFERGPVVGSAGA